MMHRSRPGVPFSSHYRTWPGYCTLWPWANAQTVMWSWRWIPNVVALGCVWDLSPLQGRADGTLDQSWREIAAVIMRTFICWVL